MPRLRPDLAGARSQVRRPHSEPVPMAHVQCLLGSVGPSGSPLSRRWGRSWRRGEAPPIRDCGIANEERHSPRSF